MKTKRDIDLSECGERFRRYVGIVIPRGTRTDHMTAMGYDEKYDFVSEFDWVPGGNRMLYHDAMSYGISVKKEDLE